ncbi:MAG: hypothetical protein ABIH50_01950 [bacterium]
MRIKYLALAAVLVSVVFYLGCAVTGSGTVTKFTIFDPSVTLTDAELATIGATGLTGTDEAETAANILTWQKAKMTLTTPNDHADASYSMRWNYIMPGIFPVNQMITERTSVEAGGTKLYGVCWDFAAIYISVARKYGLTTRMTAWKKYMSNVAGGQNGMGQDEYNALNVKLQSKGLNFSYDQINNAAKETWIHYRAEVKVGANWIAFDGTNPTGEYANDANYSEVSWDDGADPALTQ